MLRRAQSSVPKRRRESLAGSTATAIRRPEKSAMVPQPAMELLSFPPAGAGEFQGEEVFDFPEEEDDIPESAFGGRRAKKPRKKAVKRVQEVDPAAKAAEDLATATLKVATAVEKARQEGRRVKMADACAAVQGIAPLPSTTALKDKLEQKIRIIAFQKKCLERDLRKLKPKRTRPVRTSEDAEIRINQLKGQLESMQERQRVLMEQEVE